MRDGTAPPPRHLVQVNADLSIGHLLHRSSSILSGARVIGGVE